MKRRKSTSKKLPLWSSYSQSRTTCRACGGPLETVLDLGVQQIVNLGDKEKRSAPLELSKCQSCSLVQLRHTVDREYLFRSYYYRSGATQTMKDHLKGVVDDALKRVELKRKDVVLDIGSNDGTLLSFIPNDYVKVGFDPAGLRLLPFAYSDFIRVDNFFTAKEFESYSVVGDFQPAERRKAKLVFQIASFYDLEDPNAFLQDVKRVLAPDGLFCLQVNYLPDTLRNNAVGDICHEHLCYYTYTTLESLLGRNRFTIEDVSFSEINGGSVRLFIRHVGKATMQIATLADVFENETTLGLETSESYEAFADRISTIARKTREYIETLRKMGKTVSVIGASTRGATFIQYANLNRYGILLDCVERDPSKVGKRYLGMPIISEEEDKTNPADWYLLTTNWFREEIMKRMPHARRFIVPLPEPRVVVDGVETPL